MAIYMNFNKKKIKGGVTAKGYEGCIAVQSISLGVGRNIHMQSGGMKDREVSRPTISEMNLTMTMSPASAALFKEALAGTEGVEVLIDIVKTGSKEVQKYVQYKLTDTLVSSYSVSNSSEGGPPIENVSLSFAKLEFDGSAADKTNKNQGSMKVGYNLETATPL